MALLKSFLNKIDLDIEKDSTKFFLLLISADIFFILLNIVYLFYDYRGSINSIWSIETDRGLAESYQYVKEFWIILLLLWLTVRFSRLSLLTWVSIFTYILADDMLELHERFGDTLSRVIGFKSTFGLRPQDIGELSFFAIFGIIFSILIIFTYFYNRKDYIFSAVNRRLLLLLGFLALFGAAIDALHSMTGRLSRTWEWPHLLKIILFFSLGLIEDGGEMIIMSIAVWSIFLLASQFNRETTR